MVWVGLLCDDPGPSIRRARGELQRRGLSLAMSKFQRALRRLLGRRPRSIGNRLKSWDLLETVGLFEANCAREEVVLDIGSYGSEIAPIMLRMGFRRVIGVDLDPGLAQMKSCEVGLAAEGERSP